MPLQRRIYQSGEYEHLDTTPVEMPTRLRLPQSRTDQIRQFIREEISRKSAHEGQETFEEADDIEPDDEGDLPLSPYELQELEPPASPSHGSPAKPGSGAAIAGARVPPQPKPTGEAAADRPLPTDGSTKPEVTDGTK